MTRTVKIGNRNLGLIEAAPKPGSPATFWGAEDVFFLSHRLGSIHIARTAIAGLRIYGVTQLGVRTVDGSTYTIEISAVQAIPVDMTKRYLATQISAWVVTKPPEEDRVKNTLSEMRIPGGRKRALVEKSK